MLVSPRTARWIELDKQYVWHPFTPMRQWLDGEPLVIERAEGNYLIDSEGRRYLDGVSSLWVTVHGHGRPEINRAIVEQLERMAHSTLLGLSHPTAAELAARLIECAPPGMARVFYSDNGSTAVEIALKVAFQYWQLSGRPEKRRFAHLAQAYHGDTLGAVAVGGIDLFHAVFGPLLIESFTAPTPHVYRHPAGSAAEVRDQALAGLAALLEQHGDEIAAFILEPLVQGAAGMLVHPDGYLAGAAALCRKHDVLLIADEVATGFGRTGTLFACSQEKVTPDLLCLAKGLTGGYTPLAATLMTQRVYEPFLGARGGERRTFFHGHTYTGHSLGCAAALASLDLFERDRVLESLPGKSERLRAALRARLGDHPHVGDIRLRGLMVGIELVADRASAEPFAPDAVTGARVCMAARSHGVLLRPLGDVVVLMPPLSITGDEIDALVGAVAAGLDSVL